MNVTPVNSVFEVVRPREISGVAAVAAPAVDRAERSSAEAVVRFDGILQDIQPSDTSSKSRTSTESGQNLDITV